MGTVIRVLKRSVAGTPLEPVGRNIWRRVRPKPAPTPGQLRNAEYDRLTYEIIRRLTAPDGHCVDVGCNVGKVLKVIVATAPNGVHHAFEPLPHFAARLRDEFPTVSVHEVALSDRSGRSTFHHLVEAAGYSGLQRRYYDHEVTDRVIEVEVARLDDVIDPDYRIDVLKIDVEGGELDVMRGGREHIVRSKPAIVFEWGDRAAAPYGWSRVDVHRFLADCDLSVSHLRTYLDGGPPMDEEAFLAAKGFMFVGHP